MEKLETMLRNNAIVKERKVITISFSVTAVRFVKVLFPHFAKILEAKHRVSLLVRTILQQCLVCLVSTVPTDLGLG